MKRTIIASVIACLLGAATVGTVGLAASGKSSKKARSTQAGQYPGGPTGPAKPSGPPPTMGDMLKKEQAAKDAILKKVADALNVDQSKLEDAVKAVEDDALAAAVKNNRLTQDEVDAIKACQAAPLTCDRTNLPAFGPGFEHGGFGFGLGFGLKMMRGGTDPFQAVADKLGGGITAAQVRKAFFAALPRPMGFGRHGGPGFGGPGFGGHGHPMGPPPGAPQGNGQYPSGPAPATRSGGF